MYTIVFYIKNWLKTFFLILSKKITIFLTSKIIYYNNLHVFMGIWNWFTRSHSLLGMLLYTTPKVVFRNLIYD
jgi:hypothetical protein